MKNIKDLIPCTVCRGMGKIYKPLPDSIINNKTVECPHCKGTKLEPEKINIDVPEGYSIYRRSDKSYTFAPIGIGWCKDLPWPYPQDHIEKWVCEKCNGIPEEGYCSDCVNGDECKAYTHNGGCMDNHTCPECYNESKKTTKVFLITVEDNNFVIYWEEVK